MIIFHNKKLAMFLAQPLIVFKVTSIHEESEEASDSFFGAQILGFRRPLDVVRKLVTTQRRTSLQRLSSSITNLSEVHCKWSAIIADIIQIVYAFMLSSFILLQSFMILLCI